MKKIPNRILFFIERNLHLPFLEPVHDYFRLNYPEIKLAFSSPAYRPPALGRVGRGIDDETKKRLLQKSLFLNKPEDFNPDISFIADINAAYYLQGCGKIVNIGHSLNSKGRHYTNRPIVLRENLAHLVCVPGPFHYKILRQNLVVPVKTTGYIKSDTLFGPSSISKEQFCLNYKINPTKKIILFAPTFDYQLSAIPVIKDKIFDLAGADIQILIKLHGMTDEKWVKMYKDMSKAHSSCTFITESDITPCIQVSDILISDVSSAFLEFMLLNKPIILVDNPLKSNFAHFDPSDIEYRAREACTVVSSAGELNKAVTDAIDYPRTLEKIRKKYISKLTLKLDGKCAQRTAEAAIKHFNKKFPIKFTIFVPWDHPPSEEDIKFYFQHIKDTTYDFDTDIFMAGFSRHNRESDNSAFKWIESRQPDASILKKIINQSSNEYIAIVRPHTILPDSWLKFMMSHLNRNKDAGLIQALQIGDDYNSIINNYFPDCKNYSLSEIARKLNIFLIGSALLTNHIDSSCIMFTKSTFNKLKKIKYDDKADLNFSDFSNNVINNGFSILKALDVFTHTVNEHHQNYQKQAFSLQRNHSLDQKACEASNKSFTYKDLNSYYETSLRQNIIFSHKRYGYTFEASIIIPVLDNLEYTKNCLDSVLLHTDIEKIQIIVVDNGSQKNTSDYLEYLNNKRLIKVITNSTNLGFAKACNQGAIEASGQYLVFLNNDTKVTPGWLHLLLKSIRDNPARGAAGPKLLYPDDTVQHAGIVFTSQKTVLHIYKGFHKDHPAVNKPRNYQALSAACLIVKKEIFTKADMFDEQFQNGFEDVDLCLKLNKDGLTCHYCPQVEIYHYESKTSERFKHNRENELLLGKKWSKQISCDEYMFYEKDLMIPDRSNSVSGETSFLLHDSNVNFFWENAKTLKNDGKFIRALEMYNQALQFNPYDPRNFTIMEELSQLLVQMNFLPQAEKCLESLVKSSPTKKRYLELSKIQKKMGKINKATVSIHKSMELK